MAYKPSSNNRIGAYSVGTDSSSLGYDMGKIRRYKDVDRLTMDYRTSDVNGYVMRRLEAYDGGSVKPFDWEKWREKMRRMSGGEYDGSSLKDSAKYDTKYIPVKKKDRDGLKKDKKRKKRQHKEEGNLYKLLFNQNYEMN